MRPIAISIFATLAIIGLALEAQAAPCQDYLRLRNEAAAAWRQAITAPPPERCGALYHASSSAEATLRYADHNRESCDLSVPILNSLEAHHREAVQARDNVCSGRPMRPFPADIIRH
jgi:hypothetical protein